MSPNWNYLWSSLKATNKRYLSVGIVFLTVLLIFMCFYIRNADLRHELDKSQQHEQQLQTTVNDLYQVVSRQKQKLFENVNSSEHLEQPPENRSYFCKLKTSFHFPANPGPDEKKIEFIRNMAKSAWRSFLNQSHSIIQRVKTGKVNSTTQEPIEVLKWNWRLFSHDNNRTANYPVYLVAQSLTTFYLMNLTEEYEEARQLIQDLDTDDTTLNYLRRFSCVRPNPYSTHCHPNNSENNHYPFMSQLVAPLVSLQEQTKDDFSISPLSRITASIFNKFNASGKIRYQRHNGSYLASTFVHSFDPLPAQSLSDMDFDLQVTPKKFYFVDEYKCLLEDWKTAIKRDAYLKTAFFDVEFETEVNVTKTVIVPQTRKETDEIDDYEYYFPYDIKNIQSTEYSSYNVSTLFYPIGDFYADILRAFIQTNATEMDLLYLFQSAIQLAMEKGLLIKGRNETDEQLWYLREKVNGELQNYMDDSGCELAGILALAGSLECYHIYKIYNATDRWNGVNLTELAVGLTNTCHLVANKCRTGLLPIRWSFENGNINLATSPTKPYENNQTWSQMTNPARLTPELASTYFYMYRLTRNPLYREWAWENVQAIHKNAVNANGHYTNVAHACDSTKYVAESNKDKRTRQEHQPASFIGGTLKYLYLTFASPDTLPLDKWVFNRFGQPMPIK